MVARPATTAFSLIAALAALAALAGCHGGNDNPAIRPPTATAAAATTTTPPPVALAWHARADAPAPRQEVAAAAVRSRIWVVGGLDANGSASTRVDEYDPATDKWARGPDLPVALHHLSAVVFGGDLVVLGGFQASGGDLYGRPSDRVFARRGDAWVELPHLLRPRGAAGAAVVGDRLVVAGGRDATLLVGPTEVFDGTRWEDRAPIPVPRDHLAAETDGRYLYAIGGRLLSPGRTSDVFERYDPASDAWETLPAIPTARGGLGAALLGGRLVTAGGEDATGVYPQTEAYDIAAGTWTSLTEMARPRHGLALVTVGNAAYALMGGTRAGVAPSASADALSPA